MQCIQRKVHYVIFFFFFSEQTAKKVVILDKANIKATQGANFVIADPIIIEVRDVNNNRIYSGRDASLVSKYTCTYMSFCISVK